MVVDSGGICNTASKMSKKDKGSLYGPQLCAVFFSSVPICVYFQFIGVILILLHSKSFSVNSP